MAHGGYGKRRVAPSRRSKGMGLVKKAKHKPVSLKNQIRSIERMLRKELPVEVREAQEKKLEEFKKQQEVHNRLAIERRLFLRDRKIKFFERRKIERRIRRLEKQQRSASGTVLENELSEQLFNLKEDLEYVRFFPKNEKYVSLFTGGEDVDLSERRARMREQIKANLVAAAASGKDLEGIRITNFPSSCTPTNFSETGSEDDGLIDLSDDDFFLSGSSSDEADADDEWTDKSAREQGSSASGKAASGMSSDERNQDNARALMPPPASNGHVHLKSRFGASSSKSSRPQRSRLSYSSGKSGSSSKEKEFSRGESGRRSNLSSNQVLTGNSNLSSNSDAHKPRRKRRKKKKQQG